MAVLLGEHWDALDFDFRRLGLDLEEVCFESEAFDLRRIGSYISYLGPDSAIAREMGWSWDDMREMTATLIEVTVNRGRKKGQTPYKHPRPDGLKKAGAAGTADQVPLTRESVRAALL